MSASEPGTGSVRAPTTRARSVPDQPADVAVADKNPLVLQAFKQLIGADPRFNLAVAATDGERFLDAVRRVPFDVGVIGWLMPYADGRAVLAALREQNDTRPIIVYTGTDAPDIPSKAMAAGAAGFCPKSQPPEQLLETIAQVAAGRMVFPFLDVRTLYHDPLKALTDRERELLAALPLGRTNAQLARDFGISINTVKFHLKGLYAKLEVVSRAQAVGLYLSATLNAR